MNDRPFVHLHCHTHYSLLDGASRIPELVALVREQGMNAVAITDHGNLYGAIQFYKECTAAGINPIIGYEAYVAPGKRTDRDAKRRGEAGFHLTLLAQNRTGFQNLIKMASLAYLQGFHHVPRIDKELLAGHKEGLICLSGCASGEFSDLILKDQREQARDLAAWFARVFGKHFYVEIQNNGLAIQRLCAEGAIDIANHMGLPLVATCDAHYLRREDAGAHDVLLCINTGAKRNDLKRMRYGEGDELIDQFYVRPPEEMYSLFPDQEAAVRRSQEIADGCQIELNFKARHFPTFTPPEGKTAEEHLRELCYQGMRERYGESPRQEVIDRLEHELGIICRMGFASYFLITHDFVRFSVENQIPCSARGSACGSVVSYVLRLSHVDPLEYDLLFERFLDPHRSEAPDIDIDFCQDRRDSVIAYVRDKYGEESVAQIVTFGTLAARAAIKDVGRVLDVPFERVNQLTNLVPTRLGITIDDALKESPELRELYDMDVEVRELIDIARKLEGTNRQTGIHAAGVVISSGPLLNHVPLHRGKRKGQDTRTAEPVIATQWEMGDLEKVGMLKMDFLGLRTLTVLDNALALIEKTRGEKINLETLPLDDQATYDLLQRGDAKGVFQFESDGIRELLKRLRPDNIRDIIACTALYRPGPLQGGMVDSYINRKHGREQPTYEHPILEEILSETYGVMCYQEQIMRILNVLGGIELSKAYQCIKAISKKKQEIIDQRRVDFIQGAKGRGVDEKTAEQIFGLIVFFGGYGFNKSHSAAYAHVSYQTAYLKAHYPAEFMAALLSSEIEDGNKRDILVEHIEDARHSGVEVLPPDINSSESDFTVQGGKIVFGLAAIKGCGRSVTEAVVRARKMNGPFKDLFDFCEHIDTRMVTQAAIERLIKAGALDRLGGHRAQLIHILPRALQAARDRQQDRLLGQGNLFETLPPELSRVNGKGPVELPEVAPWTEREKLAYEKEVLDFYVSSHPLAHMEKDLARLASHKVEELKSLPPGQEVTLGGMLVGVRLMNTKRARNGNTRYARFKLDSLNGSVECVLWPDDYLRCKGEVVESNICIIKGTIELAREEPSLIITRVMNLEQARRELATGLHLQMRLRSNQLLEVDALAEVLRNTPGACPVHLWIRDPAGRQAHLKLGREFCIDPCAYDKDRLEGLLGSGNVRLM